MLKYLYGLVKHYTFFNVFQYITFRSAYAAITALLVCFLVGAPLIRLLKKLDIGQSIRKDGPESHLKKSGTPTMGGVLIILAVVVSMLLWQELENPYTWILLLAVLGFGGIGFADDYLKIVKRNAGGLRAGVKFIGQTILATAIVVVLYTTRHGATTQLYLPFLKKVKSPGFVKS